MCSEVRHAGQHPKKKTAGFPESASAICTTMDPTQVIADVSSFVVCSAPRYPVRSASSTWPMFQTSFAALPQNEAVATCPTGLSRFSGAHFYKNGRPRTMCVLAAIYGFGYGSKLNHQETAGLSPSNVPGQPIWGTWFLTPTHILA